MSFKKILLLSCAVMYNATNPIPVNPQVCENIWQIVYRIGLCLDATEQELASISDLLVSQLDDININILDVDTDLLSVSDFLSSKIMAIDSINDIQELSIGDALCSKIMDL